jgi:predicted enzyme related to lactoylglutathione lyase
MSSQTGNPVSWFEIYVQDMARAQRFYENVFEVKLETLGGVGDGLEMRSFKGDMDKYGTSGALVHMPGVPSGGNSTMVYFECADCAVQGERAKRAGGSIEREKMSIGPYGFIVLIRDSEGNLIGLHSMQ